MYDMKIAYWLLHGLYPFVAETRGRVKPSAAAGQLPGIVE
jgi:hypothetical protein